MIADVKDEQNNDEIDNVIKHTTSTGLDDIPLVQSRYGEGLQPLTLTFISFNKIKLA